MRGIRHLKKNKITSGEVSISTDKHFLTNNMFSQLGRNISWSWHYNGTCSYLKQISNGYKLYTLRYLVQSIVSHLCCYFNVTLFLMNWGIKDVQHINGWHSSLSNLFNVHSQFTNCITIVCKVPHSFSWMPIILLIILNIKMTQQILKMLPFACHYQGWFYSSSINVYNVFNNITNAEL